MKRVGDRSLFSDGWESRIEADYLDIQEVVNRKVDAYREESADPRLCALLTYNLLNNVSAGLIAHLIKGIDDREEIMRKFNEALDQELRTYQEQSDANC